MLLAFLKGSWGLQQGQAICEAGQGQGITRFARRVFVITTLQATLEFDCSTVLSVAAFCGHAAELSACPKQVTPSQTILVLMLETFFPAKCLSAASVSTGVRAGRIWPGAWGARSSAVLKRRVGQSENEEQGSCASRHWARKHSDGRFRSDSSAQLSPFFSRSRR